MGAYLLILLWLPTKSIKAVLAMIFLPAMQAFLLNPHFLPQNSKTVLALIFQPIMWTHAFAATVLASVLSLSMWALLLNVLFAFLSQHVETVSALMPLSAMCTDAGASAVLTYRLMPSMRTFLINPSLHPQNRRWRRRDFHLHFKILAYLG